MFQSEAQRLKTIIFNGTASIQLLSGVLVMLYASHRLLVRALILAILSGCTKHMKKCQDSISQRLMQALTHTIDVKQGHGLMRF